jgi:hypothetical protein
MRRITIRLDEETALRAEAEASHRGMTLWRWLRELLLSRRTSERRRVSERAYRRAEEQFFSIEPRPLGRRGQRYPRRGTL